MRLLTRSEAIEIAWNEYGIIATLAIAIFEMVYDRHGGLVPEETFRELCHKEMEG